jgi:hypothetical protein
LLLLRLVNLLQGRDLLVLLAVLLFQRGLLLLQRRNLLIPPVSSF